MAWSKIDDTTVQDDSPASSLVTVWTRRNILANVTDRVSAGSHGYGRVDSAAESTDYVPTFSTHPDHYYELPFVIPAQTGVTTLSCRVCYTGATASMTARLHLEGVEGTVTEELTTGGPRLSDAFTVEVPSDPSLRWWRGAIQFKSAEGSSVDGSIDVTKLGRHELILDGVGGVTNGKNHILLEYTDYDAFGSGELPAGTLRYHLGFVRDATSIALDHYGTVWPEVNEPAQQYPTTTKADWDGASLTSLGNIQLWGYTMHYTTSTGVLRGVPLVATIGNRQPIQATHIRGLHNGNRLLDRERGRILAIGPDRFGDKYHHSVYADAASTTVAQASGVRRAGQLGVRVATLLLGSEGPDGPDRSYDIADSAEATTDSYTRTDLPLTRARKKHTPSGAGTLYHWVRSSFSDPDNPIGAWGGADLGYDGDYLKLNLDQETVVDDTVGLSTGDEYVVKLRLTSTDTQASCYAACIAEWFGD